ncbi:4Fe-4S ferredoxin [Fervidicella metallireducens AeB]|uniref:4Fe-4S ferredoxin n=1 Tax=Fervidicella metallireducens AeB TaxID=1403537 RepID=A0A017RWZ2_9CLOT|nr:DUF362 domain-containing protein [Fervidicella metallireducens]EYE89071.1 4Fe-4S ferredoxin [Fervidicella metallireducens AeB]
MKSKVYFANLRARSARENKISKIKRLFDLAGFDDFINKNDITAIKIHFGEKGNDSYINPVYVRQVVDKVKEKGGKPYITDTNTLYSGSRANAVDHLITAIEHGFDYSVVGAPLIIADGLLSKNSVEVEINKKHFQKVKIAGDIKAADCMIVMSHFKGHEMAGFGGAIKNLAMGCAPAAGKQQQHSTVKPEVKINKCISCGKCIQICPVKAIDFLEKKAQINHKICIGCGECITVCPVKAIAPKWDTDIEPFLERMTEYALGAVQNKGDKIGYINFLMNITPDCDCVPWSDAPIVPDIGILASKDPVAIDKASLDLVNQQIGLKNSLLTCNHEHGKDKFFGMRENVNGHIQIKYGEEIGLGFSEYELIEI